MRRVRSDVSHRIRRRSSLLGARWVRVVAGAGLAAALALLIGPLVLGWLTADLPRTALPGSSGRSAADPEGGQSARPVPAALSPTDSPSPRPPDDASASGAAPLPSSGPAPSPGLAGSTPRPAPPAVSTLPESPRVLAAGPREARAQGAAPAPERAATGRDGTVAAPPVFWIQVGAFLDHRNADRLVERLRGEGLSVGTTVFEQSRVLYRVLVSGPEGGETPPEAGTVDRVRVMGFTVESTPDGPAVGGTVPLRAAVETSRRLREEGVPVRLKQEVGSATYRVVRVGAYASGAEAERVREGLAARGYEGVVVRDR